MLDLTLDTSTDRSLIVLSEKKTIIACVDILHGHNLSKLLVPSIQKILEENAKKLNDISKIFIGIGPGSYTGTRIAVAVAEGLSLALNIPLYSFCSLLAFIPQNISDGSFTFLFDSKHTSHFLLKGTIRNQKIVSSLDPFLLEEKDISDQLYGETLISFNPEALSESLLQKKGEGPVLLKASPNLLLLINYLNDYKETLPLKPEIIYLHTF